MSVVASSRDAIIGKISQHQRDISVVVTRGAGYKCLCATLGSVDCYPLTQAACYKWDTCAPHALLLSLGGGIIDLKQITAQKG